MKQVIISGASEGLGLELSKLFLEKGIEVIGISRSNPILEIKHIKADLSKEKDIENIIKIIKEKYSQFDCLINCAGTLSIQNLEDLNYNEVENLFKVNVLAPMKLVSGLLNEIKNNQADIVNVGSTVSFKANENQCAYGASKWAVRGINKNLQLELKKTKSRVIGFYPGGFKSKLFEKATGQKINLDGYMQPKELAKLMIQLLELPKGLEVSEIIINRK